MQRRLKALKCLQLVSWKMEYCKETRKHLMLSNFSEGNNGLIVPTINRRTFIASQLLSKPIKFSKEARNYVKDPKAHKLIVHKICAFSSN